MKLTKRTRYALTAVAYIASQPEGKKLTTQIIAEACNLSKGFLELIIARLVKDQIVQAHSGRRYRSFLAKKSNEITLLEIIDSLEGSAIKSLLLLEGISDEPWFERMKKVCKKALIEQSKVLSEVTLADMLVSKKK